MNADGSNRRQITDGALGGARLVWSPDGTEIAFAATR